MSDATIWSRESVDAKRRRGLRSPMKGRGPNQSGDNGNGRKRFIVAAVILLGLVSGLISFVATGNDPKEESLIGALTTGAAPKGAEGAGPSNGSTVLSVPAGAAIDVDSGLRSNIDGSNFPNWGGPTAGDTIDATTMIALFGEANVCAQGNGGSCTLFPAAKQLADQLNAAIVNGRCEGMAVMAMRFFHKQDNPATFAAGATNGFALSKESVARAIGFWWATQVAPPVAQASASFRAMQPTQIATELIAGMKGIAGYTMGLYTPVGAHSVTPLAVTSSSTQYQIHVYDNNYPQEIRQVIVDKASQTWTYNGGAINAGQAAQAWTGKGPGTLDLTPMTPRIGPFPISFGAAGKGTAAKGSATKGSAAASKATQSIGMAGFGYSLVITPTDKTTAPVGAELDGDWGQVDTLNTGDVVSAIDDDVYVSSLNGGPIGLGQVVLVPSGKDFKMAPKSGDGSPVTATMMREGQTAIQIKGDPNDYELVVNADDDSEKQYEVRTKGSGSVTVTLSYGDRAASMKISDGQIAEAGTIEQGPDAKGYFMVKGPDGNTLFSDDIDGTLDADRDVIERFYEFDPKTGQVKVTETKLESEKVDKDFVAYAEPAPWYGGGQTPELRGSAPSNSQSAPPPPPPASGGITLGPIRGITGGTPTDPGTPTAPGGGGGGGGGGPVVDVVLTAPTGGTATGGTVTVGTTTVVDPNDPTGQVVPTNGSVTLTANPDDVDDDDDPDFIAVWAGCTTVNGNVCSLNNVIQNQTVSVQFIPASTVKLTQNTNGGSAGGTLTGGSTTWSVSNTTKSDSKVVPTGSVVVLEAVPNKYFDVQWSGDCTKDKLSDDGLTCTLGVNDDKSVQVTFLAPDQVSLTVSSNGGGGTSISGLPDSTNACISAASQSDGCWIYDPTKETELTLTASSSSKKWHFDKWTGCDSVSGADDETCTVTMNKVQNVSANFVEWYTLTVEKAGNGKDDEGAGYAVKVVLSPDSDDVDQYTVAPGTPLTVEHKGTLTPGFVYNGATGAGCDYSSSCGVTMTSDVTVTLHFDDVCDSNDGTKSPLCKVTLTVTKVGNGKTSGLVKVDGTSDLLDDDLSSEYVVDQGTTLILLADWDVDSAFFRDWQGLCDNDVNVDGSTNSDDSTNSKSGQCTITVDRDMTRSADFGALYTLSVSLKGEGSGRVVGGGIDCPTTCSKKFAEGAPVTLTATEDEESDFDHWESICDQSEGPECQLTMNEDKTGSAWFSENIVEPTDPTTPPTDPTTPPTDPTTTQPDDSNCGIGNGTEPNPPGCDGSKNTNPGDNSSTSSTTPNSSSSTTTTQPRSGNCGIGNGTDPNPPGCDGGNNGNPGDNSSTTTPPPPPPATRYTLTVGTLGTGSGSLVVMSGQFTLGPDTEGGNSYTVDAGTTLDVYAQAAKGSVFTRWTGSCTNRDANQDGICSVVLSSDQTVEASFSKIRRVRATSQTGGTITSTEISCTKGTSCDKDVVDGTKVVLNANPDNGYVFKGWNGSCLNSDADVTAKCEVSVDADTDVTAIFEVAPPVATDPATTAPVATDPATTAPVATDPTSTVPAPTYFKLSVSVIGGTHGSVTGAGVNCDSTCSKDILAGTDVFLSANPDNNFRAVWGGTCVDEQTTDCSFTMTADTSVSVTFIRQYDLKVNPDTGLVVVKDNASGNSKTVSSGVETYKYDSGAAIELTAEGTVGLFRFTGWTGCDAPSGTVCNLTLLQNTDVKANYVKIRNLTTNVSGSGSMEVTYADGTPVKGSGGQYELPVGTELYLYPKVGNAKTKFVNWDGQCTNAATAADQGYCVIVIPDTQDISVSANFVTYADLQAVTGTSGSASVVLASNGSSVAANSGKYSVVVGTAVKVKATPKAGFRFGSWTGCESVEGDTCTVSVSTDLAVQATFVPVSTLTVIGDNGTITVTNGGNTVAAVNGTYTVDSGSVLVVTARGNDGYRFFGWAGCDSPSAATCSMTMLADKTLTANFVPARNLTVNATNGSVTVKDGSTVLSPTNGVYTVADGTVLTLEASANAGFKFDTWTGCAGTGASCSITMSSSDKTVTANFVVDTVSLSVSASNGSVTVKEGSNTLTPSNGVYTVTRGAQLSLSATADASYKFSSWSGDCSGNGACNLTMSADKSVTANFAIDGVTLSVTSPNGSVTVKDSNNNTITGSNGSFVIARGTLVTVTASADSGFRFDTWSGDCTGSTCSVRMNSDKSVTASYIARYTLSVASANGTVTVKQGANTVSAPYTVDSGTSFTLTAAAASGYRFTGWSGDCSGTGSCTVTMNSNKSVTANYVARYTLSVTSANGTVTVTDGSTTLTAPYTVDSGTSLTLTAAPASGYRLGSWTGCDSVSGNTCTVSVTSSKTVTANYIQQVTLTVTSANGTVTVKDGSTTLTAPYTVDSGTSLTVDASASSGYRFGSWTGCDSVSGSTCTVSVTSSKTVTASYIQQVTLSVTATNGSVSATSGGSTLSAPYTVDKGSSIALVPSATNGFYFKDWTGCDSVSGNTCTMSMTASKSVTANFALVSPGQVPTPTATCSGSSCSLSWTAPSYVGQNGIGGYRINASDGTTTWSWEKNATTATVSNLKQNSTFTFTVEAFTTVNGTKVYGAASAGASFSTGRNSILANQTPTFSVLLPVLPLAGLVGALRRRRKAAKKSV